MPLNNINNYDNGLGLYVDDNHELTWLKIKDEGKDKTIIKNGLLHENYSGISGTQINQKVKNLKDLVRQSSKQPINKQDDKINTLAQDILKDLKAIEKLPNDIKTTHSDVCRKVYINKINQIKNNTPKYRYLSKILVGILTIAILSGIIGSAALLTNFGDRKSVV